MSVCLCERLTYDTLFRSSDPRRVYRSFTVRGPPMEIDSYQDAIYYIFNFKANPSTTGLRHRGYIKFFKPKRKNPKDVPLQHLECLVDCGCPDFRYRWAWSLKQRGSSRVGPGSLNQAWNKAPRITNPKNRVSMCKHLLAARGFIYSLLSSFPSDRPDTAEKLDKLTKIATKRWTDFEGAMQAAKAREQVLLQRRAQRNVGMIVPQPMVPVTPPGKKVAPPAKKAPEKKLVAPTPKKGPAALLPPRYDRPEPLPEPEPKGTPRKPVKTAKPPPLSKMSTKGTAKPKRVLGNRIVQGMIPGQWPGQWESLQYPRLITVYNYSVGAALDKPVLFDGDDAGESVVNANDDHNAMSTLRDTIKLVEEMENDELALHQEPDGDEFDAPSGGLDDMGTLDQPMEPPVSDTAIGADTEGETALGLLRQMKDLLTQIATAVAPEQMVGDEEMAGAEDEMGGAAGVMPDEGGEGGMPGEPPAQFPGGAGEEEAGEFEPEDAPEEEEEEGQTRPVPKKKEKKEEE